MPELPDVEIFGHALEAAALSKTINTVDIDENRILKTGPSELRSTLQRDAFEATYRHGKYLFAELSNASRLLVLHFGMSGFLQMHGKGETPPHHTHLDIHFNDGSSLAYSCMRKLGVIDLTESISDYCSREALGPDALAVSEADFKSMLMAHRGMVKSTLMDQTIIAGLGNIYTDEILFQAGIYPKKKAKQLTDEEMLRIHNRMETVLQKAVEKHADPDQFPGSFITPLRQEEARCPKCQTSLEKMKVAGRSTYYCPACQQKQ